MLTQEDLVIDILGPNTIPSPLHLSSVKGDGLGDFVPGESRVRYQVDTDPEAPHQDLSFERAGPREKVYFDACRSTAAIVTCGGLCPGLNNVIRSITLELLHNYRASKVWGVQNGYMGLDAESGLDLMPLTSERVGDIHKLGGTILGTSRGPQDPAVAVEYLRKNKIDVLFCVGGDGTQRGAHALYQEVTRRNLKISIVGVPKTIDNDIMYVHRTFGFATALEVSQEALRCGHTEARAALNGIGLVKLMGRDAGFITAGAVLANQETNYALVPEVAFEMEGPNGFLTSLENRLQRRKHALIVVAEGAGQHLFDDAATSRDASGNLKHHDIGLLLKERITAYFAERNVPISLKYIDPSYMIRSVPANTADRILSDQMARHAVHAAMAGNTNMLVGLWNNRFIHVPICTAVRTSKRMETEGDLWTSVLLTTGQPRWKSH